MTSERSLVSPRTLAPRLGQLDGLRGVAVLAVLLFHTSLFPGGFLGVDLFFTLSGFVITAGLLREARATRRIDVLAFLARRCRRLLPSLLALVGVVSIVVAMLATPAVRHHAIEDLPWALVQLLNWHFIETGISYGHITDVHVFAHLWSIAVEWQFYLVWPILLGLLTRLSCGHRLLIALIVAATIVSAVLMAVYAVTDTTRAYEGTDARASSLLLGALAATDPVRRLTESLHRGWASAVGTLLGIALLVLWLVADGTDALWLYRGGFLAHSIVASALIAILAAHPRIGASRAIGSAMPRWLGKVSYSVYLWHWPLVVLLPAMPGESGVWLRASVVIAGSILMGWLSTRFIERPVQSGARWARGRSGAIALVGAGVMIVLIWLALPRPDLGAGTVDLQSL
ncbi:acyltransferase family protein [Pseudoclavibacter sp. VKM Ac-2888]|uniref:acyltransferase family protein n=1 Tax=Pseudoclavibacter sp. VKM Ac-2888 TaxID=2783830 RepID=UPI001E5DEC66|nr:acyltransferase [Pseudoclavibacter sp. VKM Ac-2888]